MKATKTTFVAVLVAAMGIGACGGRVTPVGQELFDPPPTPPTTTLPDEEDPPVATPPVANPPVTEPQPPSPPIADPGLPPISGVPCGPGQTVELTFPISAGTMAAGAGDPSGPGYCTGSVTFFDDLSRVYQMNMADYGDGPWPNYDTPKLLRAPYNGLSRCSSGGPSSPHCATVVYGDGHVKPRYCSVVAMCENGVARATGFTW